MLIRRETAADIPAVRALTAAAFAKPDDPDTPNAPVPVEVPLLDALRGCDGWLPPLSLVAAGKDGEPIGHVVCTRGQLENGEAAWPAVGLGPLSVRPDQQGRGVGQALTHAVLGAADALGEPFVALLGSPAYYGRFGFRASTEYGITAPDPSWDAYFQIRTLAAYDPAQRGVFRYAEPFSEL